MPLDLSVVITGRVAADVIRVLVAGVEVPIVGGGYELTVPASRGVVTITAIDRDGREWPRTLQISAVATANG